MVMESGFDDYIDYVNGFSSENENTFPVFDQFPSYNNAYRFRDEPLDLSFLDVPVTAPSQAQDPPTVTLQVGSPDEYEDSVSKYLKQILVEENMKSRQSMFHDPLALQATEQEFFEAIGKRYLPLQPNVASPDEICYGSTSEHSTSASNSSVDPKWVRSDSFEAKSSVTQAQSVDYHPLVSPTTSVTNDVTDTMDSILHRHMVQNMFTDSESILLFKKGMEEASKFLPQNKPFVIDLDKYNLPSDSKNVPPDAVVKVENIEMDSGFRGRKHSELEDSDFEDERTTKQYAVYEDEELELSEFFNKLLLCTNDKGEPVPNFGGVANHNNLKHVYSGWNAPWRPGNANESIDIKTLLIDCAQLVPTDDHKGATEKLKHIRQLTSPTGNASQRLAHIFELGLEARLSGTGSHLCTSQKATQISAAEKMRAFQAYLSACPFKQNEIYFANRTIHDATLTSSILHIVDFGIGYGFQWPVLVKHLAIRPGGPPKLRITGIELPQRGFRPAEQLEETGRRLATYCERFKVPFEYNAIATQDWEMINIEDLKLQRNEFLVVNCLARFENLLDETNVKDSPRDRVLKLVRDMKPDIFIHSIVNGSYGAPFFFTRFKEALFHYSALFDMLDATIDRDDEQRQNYEKAFLGREVMNVIACEGHERVERPETYQQWQVRTSRAGFKPRRVDHEIYSQLKAKVKVGYNKDFVLDDNGKWMLQGWKGRILYAISCWVPA